LWPRTTRAGQNPRSSFAVAQQPERHDFPRLNCTELYRSSLSNSRASSESAAIGEVTPRRAVFFIGTGRLPLSSRKNKTARPELDRVGLIGIPTKQFSSGVLERAHQFTERPTRSRGPALLDARPTHERGLSERAERSRRCPAPPTPPQEPC